MTNSTLTTASFTLAPTTGGPALAGAVNFCGNTAVFVPSASLVASTQYTATITTAAKDVAGNALAAQYTWSFTTGVAGATAAACPVAGPPAVSVAPSRISGVAPLAVFFDATGTTSPLTTKPFHNIEYRWDFGDPGSCTWTTGSGLGANSGNSATGAVSAHVFERPGTYTVAMTALDGTNTAACSVQITVSNPDIVFSGTNTHCFSNGSDFTGCPSGSTPHPNVNTFESVRSFIATGRRLLLRRGDTFNVSSLGGFNDVNGPWEVGAFGSGPKPVLRATADDVYLIEQGCSGGPYSDIRIMDLTLDGNGHANNQGISYEQCGNTPEFFYSDFLISRVDIRNVYRGIETFQQTGVFIVDSTVVSAGYTSFSGGMINSAMLGNSLTQTSTDDIGEGNVRWGNANKVAFSNNDVIGAAFFRQHLKLHSQDGVASRYFIASDNKFAGGADEFAFRIGPQDPSSVNEDVQNFIVERNWFVGHLPGPIDPLTGLPKFTGTSRLMQLAARYGTVRNNLFDFSSADTGANWALVVNREGSEPVPDDIQIYNNTTYSSATNTDQFGFAAVVVDWDNSGATNIVVKNNYASAPNYTIRSLLYDPNNRVAVADNSNNLITDAPGWVSATPATPDQFKPAPGSFAIGAGAVLPVWSDFFRSNEPMQRDIGAMNH